MREQIMNLRAAIERDLLAGRPAAPASPTCFICGRSYSKGDSRFCSLRCREAFDDGFPPYDPNQARTLMQVPLTAWVAVAGPPGTVGSRLYARDAPISGDGC